MSSQGNFQKQEGDCCTEKNMEKLRQQGVPIGVFISKSFLPLARTLISIPAGMISMNFTKYTISSLMGVALWNLIFIGAGYFPGGDSVWSRVKLRK
ncbi:MAG: DedA family protein [[Clostridium] scindens]